MLPDQNDNLEEIKFIPSHLTCVGHGPKHDIFTPCGILVHMFFSFFLLQRDASWKENCCILVWFVFEVYLFLQVCLKYIVFKDRDIACWRVFDHIGPPCEVERVRTSMRILRVGWPKWTHQTSWMNNQSKHITQVKSPWVNFTRKLNVFFIKKIEHVVMVLPHCCLWINLRWRKKATNMSMLVSDRRPDLFDLLWRTVQCGGSKCAMPRCMSLKATLAIHTTFQWEVGTSV